MKRGKDLIIKIIVTAFIIAIGLVFKFSFTGFFVLEAFNGSTFSENLTFGDNIDENITRYISLDKYVNVTSAYINLTGRFVYVNKSDGINVYNSGSGPLSDVTTNGSDFWVIAENVLYHFNSTGANQTNTADTASFGIGSGVGITTNGSDFWILDIADDFVYHLNSSWANQSNGFYIGGSGAAWSQGISTNGSDFWTSDTGASGDGFVYHFNSTGANQSDGFNILNSGIDLGLGITTNATLNGGIPDFWIIDQSDDFVYHFNSTGVNQSDGFYIGGFGAGNGEGITTNGSDFWIVDSNDYFIYHISKSYPSNAYIDVGNDSVQEWNHTGSFNLDNNKTGNLASAINDYLSTCTEDSTGNCTVPFVFHSDTNGTIEYFGLKIEYNDTQAPSITLSPSTNQQNVPIGSQLSISCSASDNIGTPTVSVTVAGGSFCSGTGSCSGTYTVSTTGDKTVTCSATDTESNSASSSITISPEGGGAAGGGAGGGGAGEPKTEIEKETEIAKEIISIKEVKEILPLEILPSIEPIIIEEITAEVVEDKIVINLENQAILLLSFEEGLRRKPRLDMKFSTKEIPKLKHAVVEIKYIDWHYYFNTGLGIIIAVLIASTLLIPVVQIIKKNIR